MTIVTDERVGTEERQAAHRAGGRFVLCRYARWKHVADRLFAALLFVPAAPLILLLIVIVRLGSRGPGIYRQARVGLRGKVFTMYKIRTMRQDAEVGTGAIWARFNDPRMTTVGRFIRSLHLDEFPQLINVVRGEMALVGPRPERPEFTQILAREIPGYLDRLAVRPGITGLAQINLPPDTDFDSVRRKLMLDQEYISTASAGLDLRILCWTFLRILGLKGALTSRPLGVCRNVELPTDDASPAGPQIDTALASIVATAVVHGKASANGHSAHHNGHHSASKFQVGAPTKPR
ncbi:MAG: sugar transferase [Planctomycetia bacterium]|nr:sugar transferase [Planctomycetia bacterium]